MIYLASLTVTFAILSVVRATYLATEDAADDKWLPFLSLVTFFLGTILAVTVLVNA